MGFTRDKCLYLLFLLSLQKQGEMKKVLRKQGIEHVAIYGLGIVGTAFYKLCLYNNIDVVYGIDINTKNIDGLQVFTVSESKLPDVDIIIITPLYDNKRIIKDLQKASGANIVAVGDILNEILIALKVNMSH